MSASDDRAWPAGSATGVGSLPGDDPLAATRFVFDELPDFPHLPELPARGPGADMVGRTAAILADLHVDLQPSGWRLVSRPGVDERRARDLLARDLDALETVGVGYRGPLKLQVAGPWTLAASLHLASLDAVLADYGARRDLAESLAEGVVAHIAEVTRRVPGAAIVLQLDEPSLPQVLAGEVPTVSGFGALRAVDPTEAQTALSMLLGIANATPVVHCCSAQPPLNLLADAGARAVGVDAAQLTPGDDDAVGELVERGVGLFLGVVPALGPGAPPSVRDVIAPARGLWQRLGFPPDQLTETVVVTPACGLAGASLGWATSAYRLCRQAARALAEAPEDIRR